MAKKQTRRSISVSGDTYNAVRDYCDEHSLSASGLVTELLERYLEDNRDGPPAGGPGSAPTEPSEDARPEPAPAERATRAVRSSPVARIGAPPALRDSTYPDRRGPSFSALGDPNALPRWVVTAQLEVSRKRQVDAQASVEVLLHNLMHRRMVNSARVLKIDLLADE